MQIISRGRVLWIVALFLFSAYAAAQVSDKIAKVTAPPVPQGLPVAIAADLINPSIIQRIEVAYRPFGEQNYKRMEMSVIGNVATATIPATETMPPFLEYYLLIYTQNGQSSETYPLENAEGHPLRIDIQEALLASRYVTVLSPDEHESVRKEDLFISFTIGKDTVLDSSATQIFIDDANITNIAVPTGDLFVIHPENASITLSPGQHTIRVDLYARDHSLIESYHWDFQITGGGEQSSASAQTGWQYGGSLQLESRNEKIDTLPGLPYNRATLSANAANGIFHTSGKMYVTNEEQPDRQPQDRFTWNAEIPMLKIGLGDLYPTYPDLIMNGMRVRGVSGEVSLGSFDLSVTKGQILREIEGDTVKTFPADSLEAEQNRDPAASYKLYRTSDSLWTKFQSGTFSRDLLVIRPRFGKEDSHLGFTVLKSTDDPASIQFGIKPEENLVIGSDFLVSLANHTVDLNGQAAVSATNKDITRGTFSDADIDSLYNGNDNQSTRDNVRRVRNILSHIITVNEYLIPLTAKDFPTLAYEGGIAVNAVDNALRFNYLRHGSSFESFGQTFVRPDVAGFNVSDRVRLVSNSLLLSGGYERLKDNTAETKPATTTSTTANVGVSYFPRNDLPSLTVAYLFASNENGLAVDDTFAIKDNTNRVVVQINKDFTFSGHHQGMLSVSTSSRDDQSLRNLDTKNTTVSLGVTSTYTIPLQTVLSLMVSANSLPTIDSSGKTSMMPRNYTTLYLRGQYRLVDDRLQLSATLSPTLGDIGRTLLEGGVQYFFNKRISALTQLSLYLNNDSGNDLIGSLIVRMEL
jgi:hypothetical protein